MGTRRRRSWRSSPSSAFGGGNVFFLHLPPSPPTPPPPSPPPPPTNHRSTEGETQRLTTTWLPPPPPLPSPPPRPPGARNASREKGEGELSPRRGSFQCLASQLPRYCRAGRGRPARAHVLRALTCSAASPACPPPPSPCGLAFPSWAPPRRRERAPGWDSAGVLLPKAVFDSLTAWGLDF